MTKFGIFMLGYCSGVLFSIITFIGVNAMAQNWNDGMTPFQQFQFQQQFQQGLQNQNILEGRDPVTGDRHSLNLPPC
jgi:hypothetical protein